MSRNGIQGRKKGSENTHHSFISCKEWSKIGRHKTRSNTVYTSVRGHFCSQGLPNILQIISKLIKRKVSNNCRSSTNFGKSKKSCFGHSIHSQRRWRVITSNWGNDNNRRTLLQVRRSILHKPITSSAHLIKMTWKENAEKTYVSNLFLFWSFHGVNYLQKKYSSFDIYLP